MAEQIRRVRSEGGTVTVQGARTSIVGGAVPRSGHILNVSKMTSFIALSFREDRNEYVLGLQPGVLLCDLLDAVRTGDFGETVSSGSSDAVSRYREHLGSHFFPPDPTEISASIGGMTACNASGARTFLYGPTRPYVHGITVVLRAHEFDALVAKNGPMTVDWREALAEVRAPNLKMLSDNSSRT